MQLIKNTIELGIEKPFSFLHLSDTHLALADGRDDDRKRKLARERSGCFSKAEMLLSQAQRYALENDLLIVHTGDLIDFVSEANLDRAHALVQENDVFFAAGNHEFSLYVGEAFEDAAYRNISLKKVQSCFHNNIRFDSRKMNGVNLIVIDNGYYLFDAEQLEALKKEVEYGLPIILFMHTPLFDEQLYEFLKAHILVVGLGTAGAMSAIAAAKRGHRVIGVDAATIPGGVGTASCVWDYYFGARGGLYQEVNQRADAFLQSGIYMSSEREGFYTYPTSVKSLALEAYLENNGVTCYYSSVVTAVFTENGKVCGAEIHQEKNIKIRASVVIDGAEGAACRLLGLQNAGGRKYDHRTARFSRTVGVWDGERLCGAWRQGEQLSEYTSPEETARLLYKWSACPPCYAEQYDEQRRLYALGSITGKREVGGCETEEKFTFEDYLNGKKTEQIAFYALSQLDNSCADVWHEDEAYIDWRVLCNMNTYAFSVGVTPYMMMAKGINNLLLAGKHIGTGHTLSSGVRMRTDMEKCGEAAGVMAALSIEHGCTTRDCVAVHFDELRAALRASGCYDEDNNREICDLNLPDRGMWMSCPLPRTHGELKRLLNGVTPSLGLWAMRLHIIEVDEVIAQWLHSDSRLLRENTAVALGMLGDTRALPILREILQDEPEYHVHYWRRWQFSWYSTTELCNYVKAACLLSRLGEACDRELMKSLAEYDGEIEIFVEASHYGKLFLEKNL